MKLVRKVTPVPKNRSFCISKCGAFRLIRAPVVLTPVLIRERSYLLVVKGQNYMYLLKGVAAVCRELGVC
jgi:hypothetical protein